MRGQHSSAFDAQKSFSRGSAGTGFCFWHRVAGFGSRALRLPRLCCARCAGESFGSLLSLTLLQEASRMSEEEKAIVRACLDQVVIGMTEAREVRSWWTLLSEENRQEWKDFVSSVIAFHRALTES